MIHTSQSTKNVYTVTFFSMVTSIVCIHTCFRTQLLSKTFLGPISRSQRQCCSDYHPCHGISGHLFWYHNPTDVQSRSPEAQ